LHKIIYLKLKTLSELLTLNSPKAIQAIDIHFKPLPKSQLAIVPAQAHVSLMMQTTTILKHLNSFLK
jgi:hypothetical protein